MPVIAVLAIVAFLYFQFFKVAKETDRDNDKMFRNMQAEIDRLERIIDKQDAEIRALNREIDANWERGA